MKKKVLSFIKKYFPEIIIFALAFIFSFWLMFTTFSYKDGSMLIPIKPWGDFSSHIPLIRSFSLGNNFPPQYPLFPGEPIRYHFLFYFFVGMLEKLGLRIDLALNLLSSFSFLFLIIMIFLVAQLLFKNKFIAVMSILFSLFNGSLSFIYFFQKHTLSLRSLDDILHNNIFPAFSPYDSSLISGGFWNLNVFTNQRHLALPLAITLLIIYCLIKKEKQKRALSVKLSIIFGLLVGSFTFLHGAIFIMAILVIACLFILFPFQRKSIIIIGVVTVLFSLPRTLFLLNVESNAIFKFKPGYLVANNLSLFTWIRYWLLNLGAGSLLIPIGFLLSDKIAKKIFIAFLSIFIAGNLFQFSPDIATNHKFFNLWIILTNMFSSYVLFVIWKKKLVGKILVILCIFLLTFSGVIDIFPIINDRVVNVDDYPKNPDVGWIMQNTPKNSVFLNSSYLYHPANLAGRYIFLGWPYYSWSLGYNTTRRETILKELYISTNLTWMCNTLKANNISYVAIDKNTDPAIIVNRDFVSRNFMLLYQNIKNGFAIYSVHRTCD